MSPRTLAWTRSTAIGLSGAWVLGLGLVFALRIGFPLELEWMEGGVLHQALRFQRGESLYPPPSAEFVPFLYTPFYAVVLGALGVVLPLGFVLGRAVSVLACVAIGLGVWRAVGGEGKPRHHRAVAVGLFASGYVFTFRWLDLARPDALFMALVVWGLVLLREAAGSHRKAVLAGILVALAFWTKQTAASFVLASGIGALLVAPRQAWSYALTIAVIAGGGVLVGNALTEGWLWHYIYALHQTHAFNHERFTRKTWGMLVHAAPFLVPLLAVEAWSLVGPGRRDPAISRRGLAYWGLMAVTGAGVSALGYATQWAEPNAFVPVVTTGALALAVGLPRTRTLEPICLALASVQMLFAAVLEPRYQPIQDRGWSALAESYAWQRIDRTLPGRDAWARARALRRELAETRGPVLALHRPWWSILAGGPGHVGSMGIHDVEPADRRAIQDELRARLLQSHYAVVWIEGEPPRWMKPALSGYRVDRRLRGDERVRPMSGYMSEAGMVTPYRADQLRLVPVTRIVQ